MKPARTDDEKLKEWMMASTSFGQYSQIDPLIRIIKKDRSANDFHEIKEDMNAIAYTGEGKKIITHSIWDKDLSKNKNKAVSILDISGIEHDCYSEVAAENRIKYVFLEFIKNTGIFKANIYVWKKVFQSNGRANICIIIEDNFEKLDNE